MYLKVIRRLSTIKKEDKIIFFGSSVVAIPTLKNIFPHFTNL